MVRTRIGPFGPSSCAAGAGARSAHCAWSASWAAEVEASRTDPRSLARASSVAPIEPGFPVCPTSGRAHRGQAFVVPPSPPVVRPLVWSLTAMLGGAVRFRSDTTTRSRAERADLSGRLRRRHRVVNCRREPDGFSDPRRRVVLGVDVGDEASDAVSGEPVTHGARRLGSDSLALPRNAHELRNVGRIAGHGRLHESHRYAIVAEADDRVVPGHVGVVLQTHALELVHDQATPAQG